MISYPTRPLGLHLVPNTIIPCQQFFRYLYMQQNFRTCSRIELDYAEYSQFSQFRFFQLNTESQFFLMQSPYHADMSIFVLNSAKSTRILTRGVYKNLQYHGRAPLQNSGDAHKMDQLDIPTLVQHQFYLRVCIKCFSLILRRPSRPELTLYHSLQIVSRRQDCKPVQSLSP